MMRAHSLRDAKVAGGGWLTLQRARIILRRHPELGEVSGLCFYATRLRFGDLAFDIGANRGVHTRDMLRRGARVIAIEPQAELVSDLASRFPAATVLGVAVSDQPGEAALHTIDGHDDLASLDPGWWDADWDATEQVPVVTLNDLIERFGVPTLIKIDTEGLDDRVLATLDRPIAHLLFEVHSDFPERAAHAFAHLERIGRWEYRLERGTGWLFGSPTTAAAILEQAPTWGPRNFGNVYARAV